ncbi:TlpA disulfide reductase family protein [Persicobacter diffluens]|uniref:Thioredoxin domain-containing protein n=1 Tax=Persicobacter diffluens TaxID=981 RepID=A0AAN5AJ45_9BACT|nr:hypothetical protein PEDI_11010 [Persicobacter diffluens]
MNKADVLIRLKKHWLDILLAGFLLMLVFMPNLRAPVLGFLQGLILKTGIFQPSESAELENMPEAEYQWMLLDENGEEVPFEDFKGKTIFLNFWATWCPPCIAELPDILALEERTDPEKVAFVLVNMDKEREALEKFLNKGPRFNSYRLKAGLPEVFRSQVLPTTYVISPNGKVISTKKGMAKYNTDHFKTYLESGGQK